MNASEELRTLASEYLDGYKQSSNVFGFSFMELVGVVGQFRSVPRSAY